MKKLLAHETTTSTVDLQIISFDIESILFKIKQYQPEQRDLPIQCYSINRILFLDATLIYKRSIRLIEIDKHLIQDDTTSLLEYDLKNSSIYLKYNIQLDTHNFFDTVFNKKLQEGFLVEDAFRSAEDHHPKEAENLRLRIRFDDIPALLDIKKGLDDADWIWEFNSINVFTKLNDYIPSLIQKILASVSNNKVLGLEGSIIFQKPDTLQCLKDSDNNLCYIIARHKLHMDRINPFKIIYSLSYQLAQRFPIFATLVENIIKSEDIKTYETNNNLEELFNTLLIKPLTDMDKHYQPIGNRRFLILIDNLHELGNQSCDLKRQFYKCLISM